MPYIKKENRLKYKRLIKGSIDALSDDSYAAGSLNYYFSSIINEIFTRRTSYQTINDIVGCLESIKAEFQRRKVAAYENLKIHDNGDI